MANRTQNTMEMSPLNPVLQFHQNGIQMPGENEEAHDGLPNRERATDEEVVTPITEHLNLFWMCLTFGAMTFCMLDMGSDIYVAYNHYILGRMTFFYWTLAFIIPSSVLTNILSLLWYIETGQKKGAPKTTVLEWMVRVLFLLLQLGPVLRYIDTYRFGRRSNKTDDNKDKRKFYQLMTYEREDAALIRLFECFLEAAPQMSLQIYIMTDPDFKGRTLEGIIQYVSCGISLAAVSFAMVSHQRAMRSSQNKDNSWEASFIQIHRKYFPTTVWSSLRLLLCQS